MASFSSLMAAAMVPTPTGPPPNLSMIVRSSLRSTLVESVLVHFEQLQRGVRDVERDRAVGAHLRVVAHAPQQAIGDARRAARPPRQSRRRRRLRSAR